MAAPVNFRILLCKTLLTIVSVLFALTIVLLMRAITIQPKEIIYEPCKPTDADFIPASEEAIQRFVQAIRIQTVSKDIGDYNREELMILQEFLRRSFPTLHSSHLVTQEVVANYSLLYKVSGANTNLLPFMLCAHLDVVPAVGEDWEVPPFEGKIQDGFLYGRGTIDAKHSLMGIFEAVEFLLGQGYQPQRTFYLAFGHDEEINGLEGALSISKLLQSRGIKFEYLLDEGTTVLDGVLPMMKQPTALVGTAEKGYLALKLTVNVKGGHSSMPERESSIGILANAIAKLEANPQPSMFGRGPEWPMLEGLAHQMTFFGRLVMSNLWIFAPLVSRALSRSPGSNAMIRTTTAVTEFNAGIKANILAPTAQATVNHRIHPGQTVQEVIDYDVQVINDDRVKISQIYFSSDPSPISPTDDDAFGYQTIKTSIKQVFETAAVAPGLLVGNTDTRHYHNLTNSIYRFTPSYMKPVDLKRFHGINERISIKNYEQVINFYYHLIKNSDAEKLKPMHTHSTEL